LPLVGRTLDEHVRLLDPLCFDPCLPAVWEANSTGDVSVLISMLRNVLPSIQDAATASLPESLAVMRDLGVLLGSVKRHGVEPVAVAQELEKLLPLIARRSGMVVPRDTIYHYILWNPVGPRERMYTGLPMERMLMSAVRVSLPMLNTAVDVCASLGDSDPDDLAFATALNELATLVGAMRDSMDVVIANVSPEFFARTMRPYFEDIRVGRDTWLGPAAAHVPLALIDLRLWASDHADDGYLDFVNHSAPYTVDRWRPLYRDWQRIPSLVSCVVEALERRPRQEVAYAINASAEALCRAMRALTVFRGKHLTIAREAYAPDTGLYELGSGGGPLALLEGITNQARELASLVRINTRGTRRRRSGRLPRGGKPSCEF
jgi:monodechloroaminopyrrolnitrin synthase